MSDAALSTGLLDRAIRRITTVWRDMASSVAGEADETLEAQMQACLRGRGGEVSARNRAAKLAQTYQGLDEAGRAEFLRVLAGFDSDPDAVATAYAAVQKSADPAERATAKAALRRALEPPRLRLLTQFTSIPDGQKFLVDLRAFLLKVRGEDKLLGALEADLRGLLAAWFDIGFLELRRIDWNSPAALLEKLVDYEAVHAIRSWRDLKNRLDSDRRCYAFFHPRMPGEPLIFVEVALVKGLAGSVQDLLDEKAPVLDPKQADTAVFYSISNCQSGLAGISFGNFLIKQVVTQLSGEFHNLKTFATLSPIPGFRRWLDGTLKAAAPGLLSEEETSSLLSAVSAEQGGAEKGTADKAAADKAAADKAATGKPPAENASTGKALTVRGLADKALPGKAPVDSGPAALAAILARRGWWREAGLRKTAEPVLVRLCAHYLLAESRGKRALDPVAHFHLSNGARVERLTVAADTSEKGAKESATLMVNYLYDPAKIEDWHEDYAGEGKRNASTAVRKLARGWK